MFYLRALPEIIRESGCDELRAHIFCPPRKIIGLRQISMCGNCGQGLALDHSGRELPTVVEQAPWAWSSTTFPFMIAFGTLRIQRMHRETNLR